MHMNAHARVPMHMQVTHRVHMHAHARVPMDMQVMQSLPPAHEHRKSQASWQGMNGNEREPNQGRGRGYELLFDRAARDVAKRSFNGQAWGQC